MLGNARPSLTNALNSSGVAPASPQVAFYFRPSAGPFLRHDLPFWMASLVGRLLVLLIPIVAVLYPLMRFLAALYGWLMRRKIARLYGEL